MKRGMNVFFKELTAYRKGLVFWSIGMIALIGSSLAKLHGYGGSAQSVNDIFRQFPKTFQAIFGVLGFDLSTPAGYYGVTFLYIALMATVHAVLLGTDIIAKEERDRTSEFLFVKPLSRARIISAKLGGGLVNVIVLNLVTVVFSIVLVNALNDGPSINGVILTLIGGLFIMQLLFFFIGTAIAAVNKKPKSSASIATAVLLFTFIISVFISVNEKLDPLKYLSPFKYFDALTIVTHKSLDMFYVLLSAILILILIAITYIMYKKRDLTV